MKIISLLALVGLGSFLAAPYAYADIVTGRDLAKFCTPSSMVAVETMMNRDSIDHDSPHLLTGISCVSHIQGWLAGYNTGFINGAGSVANAFKKDVKLAKQIKKAAEDVSIGNKSRLAICVPLGTSALDTAKTVTAFLQNHPNNLANSYANILIEAALLTKYPCSKK